MAGSGGTSGSAVKLLAIVGMAGSGKSTGVKLLREMGIPSVYFGGMILNEMKRRGIEITADNEAEFREKIRETEGKDWVVKQAIEEIRNLIAAGQKRIVLDGVYTWTEYRILKKEFPSEITTIAYVPPKRERHKRIQSRTTDRQFTQEEINQRDYAEIENLEKGGPIAIADYYIVNDGDYEHSARQLKGILAEIGF